MTVAQKFRHWWHELFYSLAPKSGVSFAMKCRDVTGTIDLGESPQGLSLRFRFCFHISLCQACKNYLDLTRSLETAIRDYANSVYAEADVNALNQRLVRKYSNK